MDTDIALNELLVRIGKKLHHMRLAQDKIMYAVAIGIDKSEMVVSQVENGRYKPLSFDLLSKFASYYNTNINDLLCSVVITRL